MGILKFYSICHMEGWASLGTGMNLVKKTRTSMPSRVSEQEQ
jgi:hypothetical protein